MEATTGMVPKEVPIPISDEQPNKEHDDSTAQLGVDDSRRRIDKGFHRVGFTKDLSIASSYEHNESDEAHHATPPSTYLSISFHLMAPVRIMTRSPQEAPIGRDSK